MGKDVLRVLPQLGRSEPSGVYAIPQKLCLSLESFTKVLGSFGFVCGTTEVLVAEPLSLPLPLLVEARLLLLLLLCETATPTPTPIPTRARKAMTEPQI